MGVDLSTRNIQETHSIFLQRDVMSATGFPYTADPETLLRWSERVLRAPTLETVFADRLQSDTTLIFQDLIII